MYALSEALTYEVEQMLYQYHTGNALSVLANAVVGLGGHELEYPMYTDLIHGKRKPKDTRTAKEIKDGLLKKLAS